MDELSELWLGHKPIPFKQVCGVGKNEISFKHVALEPATAYAAWIAKAIAPEPHRVRGHCRMATGAMIEAFHELRQVRGYYLCPHWGEQQHWWCVALDGSVVDPTAHQFPSKGQGLYRELAGDELPVGKCMDCGSDTFSYEVDGNGDRTGQPNVHAPEFCDAICKQRTVNYMNTPVRW